MTKLNIADLTALFMNPRLPNYTIDDDSDNIVNVLRAIVFKPLHDNGSYANKIEFKNVYSVLFRKMKPSKNRIKNVSEHFVINAIKIHGTKLLD